MDMNDKPLMRTITPGSIATKDLHQFMVGAVAPRPIAFASTIDENGVQNIAPYSFFNAFSSNPPIMVFSSNRRVANNTTKDTLHNIKKNKEVVINVVNYDIVRQMALASVSYPSEISEFDKAGLTPLASEFVKPARIKESPVHFECEVNDIITLGEHGGAGHLIVCHVKALHIREDVIDDRGRIDPNKLDLVGRLGRAHYVRASGDALFDVYQAPTKLALGFDKLPKSITSSNVLTGNDIAQLAGQLAFPKEEDVLALREDEAIVACLKIGDVEALHQNAKKLIEEGKAEEAFKVLMAVEYQDKLV